MITGLSEDEVKLKLIEFGYNELSISRPKTVFKIIIEVIKEPMFILLISCGFLYILIGDYKEGIILLSTILLIITITFFQHRKTEKALEALKKLSSPRTLVIRNGVEIRIPSREIVPGDTVIINEGDRISADGELIESTNLEIDESLITGESIPVIKNINSDIKKVLNGTLVTKGRGIFMVLQTGQSTEFGSIGKKLTEIKEEPTPLQSEMKKFIRNIGIIGAVLCVLVVLLFYFTRGNFIQSVLNGLSSAMAILPEEFPVVLTIFFALGSWRLSKKYVLTRKSSAIETLGSATVLCSDKTGTITQNKMVLAALSDGENLILKDEFSKNKSTITDLLNTCFLATTPNSIDPMEKAIIESKSNLLGTHNSPEFIKELSFSHELMAMTRIYKLVPTDDYFAATKGAPETIFDLCKLDLALKEKYVAKVNELASSGLRVIAIASSIIDKNNIPENQSSIALTFMGLIGLEDPIRPEVPAAIKECSTAGIRVIMITGDFPETALNIGRQIGLSEKGILVGTQLEQLTDKELDEKIKSISILARVKPEQKLRIVEALKRNGEIVAMTGDGVNDAPALKAAHIGIAMGNKGTDVAREASSLVLLDDNFTSIVGAIRMGRKIFDNLQKAMSYILAIHIPIIGLTMIPGFFLQSPILLMPLHIVFMELIIDPISSIAFESEDEEKGIMTKPPRNAFKPFFGFKNIIISISHGFLLLILVLIVLYVTYIEGHTEYEVRAITFTTLIVGNLFLILNKLSLTRSFIAVLFNKNWSAKFILIAAFSLLCIILIFPSLSNLFSIKFPGFYHIAIAFISAFILLLTLELIKFIRNKYKLKNLA
ncbi:MAG: hypothetical protein RI883_610 [Bacteroidota bacterium]|jgi:Ca2+-transporting ATPase